MHLRFEKNTSAKCDCTIHSLSWMGKVPDELPEEKGWKLNRCNYYQEGWLASGNIRGVVGVTYSTSHCNRTIETPPRTNYNLRGHRTQVVLVKWNEPYQKLASCDSSGVIFVWIKYEGRWSIELINDRNTNVTHFSWSHDGRMALICYQDNFVLVGSVAGQRYWSSMLNLDCTITCGIWTPDDQLVYFGTSNGQLVVMDVHGAMMAQVEIASQVAITAMAWSCQKFKMEESDEAYGNGRFVLAISLDNGTVLLMKHYYDVSPVQLVTGLNPLRMEWSNNRQMLAVAGTRQHLEFSNVVRLYGENGVLLHTAEIPNSQSAVTAMTWGHNDKRLFIATGCEVHIAWVSMRIASLQLLSSLQVYNSLSGCAQLIPSLPLPLRVQHRLSKLFFQTIRSCLPETSKGLREFVSRPPKTRLHCTMLRNHHDSPTNCYTLFLEYLGGLVPLLKGKRTSKLKPEFVIFDPHALSDCACVNNMRASDYYSGSEREDSECEDICSSPSLSRKKIRALHNSHSEYPPEDCRLAIVTSNIWGTKFRIHGVADCLPGDLGLVTYKTSVLHLQPRQMTLLMWGGGGCGGGNGGTSSGWGTAEIDSEDDTTGGSRGAAAVAPLGARVVRSCSAGYLDLVPGTTGPGGSSRLVLVRGRGLQAKSRSLDSADLPRSQNNHLNNHLAIQRSVGTASVPTSPALPPRIPKNNHHSPIRNLILNSPLMPRRLRKCKPETSDGYQDLESFQKAQLRNKIECGAKRREFIMHNKAPMWNETSQVYQLDFGGRVTQESAKNFQVEFRGKQVMQFGRIDGNAYTLDFQYPFSAVQAFAVALANVTQRLK